MTVDLQYPARHTKAPSRSGSARSSIEEKAMSVSVSVPTILRPVTKGEKTVTAEGSTLAEVITDLDSRYSGMGDRLIKNGALHRFVNIYVNDEDVRFTGGLDTAVGEGDNVTILPAVAGGAPFTFAGV
jgi:molybdopterin converting factor small subunit